VFDYGRVSFLACYKEACDSIVAACAQFDPAVSKRRKEGGGRRREEEGGEARKREEGGRKEGGREGGEEGRREGLLKKPKSISPCFDPSPSAPFSSLLLPPSLSSSSLHLPLPPFNKPTIKIAQTLDWR